MSEVERDTAIKQASDLGFSEEMLDRTPTSSILEMIEKSISRHSKKHRESKSRLDSRQLEIHNNIENVRNSDQNRNDQEDDNQTIVDISHITKTQNPTDRYYERFQFLVKAKNTVTEAIKLNSLLLQEHEKKLDPDDMFVFNQEIKQQQNNLNLIVSEMREIQRFFSETNEERKKFYRELTSQMKDLSGNCKKHFQTKLQNIDEYLVKLDKESRRV